MKLTNDHLIEAIKFANEKHANQTRKGSGLPYIIHPLQVLTTLLEIKQSKNSILLCICAVLHDVVEDCGITLQEIAERFGYQVSAIVEELTSNYDKNLISKEDYLKDKLVLLSSYALTIKLIDRYCNLKDVLDMSPLDVEKLYTTTSNIISHVVSNGNIKPKTTNSKLISLIIKQLNYGTDRK